MQMTNLIPSDGGEGRWCTPDEIVTIYTKSKEYPKEVLHIAEYLTIYYEGADVWLWDRDFPPMTTSSPLLTLFTPVITLLGIFGSILDFFTPG